MESQCYLDTIAPKDYFQELPIELQFKILRQVSLEELATKCALVSKYWLALSRDTFFWKHVSLRIRSEDHNLACSRFLECCPELVKFKLSSKFSLQPIVQRFKIFRGLRILEFVNCVDLNKEAFQIITTSCTAIESLTINNCENFDDDCFKHFACLKKLKHLHLESCDGPSDDAIGIISASPFDLESLHMVDLACVSEAAILEVIEKRGHNLRTLVLEDVCVSDDVVIAVGMCQHIVNLSIILFEDITDKAMKALSLLTNMRSLSLNMGDADLITWETVLLIFQRIQYLEKLHLYWEINDDMLQKTVKFWGNLRSISFSNCPDITDTGMQYVVQECRNLLHLDLRMLWNVTGTFLASIPATLPKLRTLTIVHCRGFNVFLIRDLTESMAHLEIYLSDVSVEDE